MAETDKYNMDGHKLIWHLDRVEDWVNNGKISPLHIDLGITTGCNIACTYCYGVLQGRAGYGTSFKNRFDMPKEPLIRLMESAKRIGVRSIAYIGEGENFLNPNIYYGFESAKRVALDIGLATNGILIKESRIEEILSSLKWLRINISGATSESYAKIHQVSPITLSKVISKSSKLVESKIKNNYETTLGFQMIITKDNIDQIIPLAKLGRDIGFDYSVFKPCSDTSDKKLNSPDKEYLEMEDIFKEAESYKTKNYNVIFKRKKLQNLGLKDYGKCFGTKFIIAISGNGNVFPCGHWFNIRSDEFLMGNIIKTPLEEIVESERYWEVQKKISDEVNVNNDCESNCRQHYINDFLWDLKQNKFAIEDVRPKETDKKPLHINFP